MAFSSFILGIVISIGIVSSFILFNGSTVPWFIFWVCYFGWLIHTVLDWVYDYFYPDDDS